MLFALLPLFSFANYFGSQIDYHYAKDSNRMYVTVKYWRLCNDYQDPLIDKVTIDMPGSGSTSFTIPTTTVITDVSLFKNRYPALACKLQNSNNGVEGVEEFISTANFALDTLPFKNAIANGACTIYFSAQIGFGFPTEITTGIRGLHYNYAMLNMCNVYASNVNNIFSPNYLLPAYAEKLACNATTFIDFGAYSPNLSDSVAYHIASPLANSRVSYVYPTSPLDKDNPMHNYCIYGSAVPCSPIPEANPPVGFGLNQEYGQIAFTPTDCNEVGMTVIEGYQYSKDSFGVYKLIGIHRRDFMMRTKYMDYGQPSLEGPFDYSVFLNDTLTFQVVSKMDSSLRPPPSQRRADTVTLLISASSPKIKYYLADSAAREKIAVFKFVADSSNLGMKPIVCAVLAFNEDSLIPGRTMRSYRIYLKERLNPKVIITKNACGYVSFKLDINASDYQKYKRGFNQFKISLGNWSQVIGLDTALVAFKLPRTGVFTYHLTGGDNKTFGVDVKDTFSYYQKLIHIEEENIYQTFCNSNPSVVLKPTVFNNSTDSIKYEWFNNNILVSTDSFLELKNYASLRYKISTMFCTHQIDYRIDSFRQGVSKNQTLAICEPQCDTLLLQNYVRYQYFADSFFSKMAGVNDPSLSDNNTKYAACNVFGTSNLADRTILLYQRHKENGCFYSDTLNLTFFDQNIQLVNKNICANTGILDLATLYNNDSAVRQSKGKFLLKQNGQSKNHLLMIDSSNPLQNITTINTNNIITGTYQLELSYSNGNCSMKDATTIYVLENKIVNVLKPKDQICKSQAVYNLKQMIAADSGFVLSAINGQDFMGVQSDYINQFIFKHRDSVADFKIKFTQTNANGCFQDTLLALKVLQLPIFSLGPDINANAFTYIFLSAPLNMASYAWNIQGLNGSSINTKAGNLNLKPGENHIICWVTDGNGCSFSDTVGVNFSTQINSVASFPFKVYPNPTSGKVMIDAAQEITDIKIFDIVGHQVIPKNILLQAQGATIALEGLPTGEYLLQVLLDGQIYRTKLVLL